MRTLTTLDTRLKTEAKADPGVQAGWLALAKVLVFANLSYENKLPKEAMAWLKTPEAKQGEAFLQKYKFPKRALNHYDHILDSLRSGEDFDNHDEELDELAALIKGKLKSIAQDLDIPRHVLTNLKDICLWIHNSDAAAKRVPSNIGALGDGLLNSIFSSSSKVDPTAAKAKVEALVKKLTGHGGLNLTMEETEAARSKKAALYKEYLLARREIVGMYKERLRNLVRQSNTKEGLLPTEHVTKLLTDEGHIHIVPQGFRGMLNEKGELHAMDGKKIIGVPGPGFKVLMNPHYGKTSPDRKLPQYVFRTVGLKGEKGQNYYTHDFRAGKNEQKFEKVQDFIKQMTTLRKKWGSALMEDGTPDQIYATILEVAYQTQGRVGNPQNKTSGKQTYGLSTILKSMVNIKGNAVSMDYVGKSGVSQHHIFQGDDRWSKKALAVIKDLKKQGKTDGPLFQVEGKPVSSQQVNRFFASLGSPVTIHKLRTAKGTLMLEQLLAEPPFEKGKATETNLTKYLKEQLTKIGAQLGHVSGEKVSYGTALRAYVNPATLKKYYARYGLRPPASIEKVIRAARQEL